MFKLSGMRWLAAGVLLLSAACVAMPAQTAVTGDSLPTAAASEQSAPGSSAASPAGREPRLRNPYVQSLVDDTLAKLPLDGKSDVQRVQLIYEYLVSTVTFADPVGRDCWQYRGQPGDAPPPYLEQRALSPLAFGVGSCEDYAAAMTLLLQGIGLEAQYLPGLTVSVNRNYVDHAWAVVRLGDAWYHLDPQLERNVIKGNLLSYRYFLRGDREMLADHLWGDRWISYGKAGQNPLTAAQTEEIRRSYSPEPCLQSNPAPPPLELKLSAPPDLAALLSRLDYEKELYRKQYGELPPMEPDILPPVFGREATSASGEPMGVPAPVGAELYYGRSLLDEPLRQAYDQLELAAADWRLGIPVPLLRPIDSHEFAKLWTPFLQDQPQYFWAECRTVANEAGQITAFVLEPPADMTIEQLKQRLQELDSAADQLLKGIDGDRYQQVCQLYDRLVLWVSYVNEAGADDIDNPYGALVGRQGLCNGISQAFQYSAQKLGITTLYIPGTTPWGSTHAWNAVLLEDGWYYLDATWGRSQLEGVVFHDYLLVTRAEMNREHLPLPTLTAGLPDAVATTGNYYIRGGSCAVNPLENPNLLAEAFVPQITRTALNREYRQVYTEIKVAADAEGYAVTRDYFIKNIFAVLEAINRIARNEGLHWQVRETQQVVLDYNDVTQTLSILLYAKNV